MTYSPVLDGAGAITFNPVNQNTDGAGTPGGNDSWLLVASNVPLVAGTKYTVTLPPIPRFGRLSGWPA